jgi:hypothetical protein
MRTHSPLLVNYYIAYYDPNPYDRVQLFVYLFLKQQRLQKN